MSANCSGVPAHYIKQTNETVALYHGEEQAIAEVFLLFKMRHAERLKYRQIAMKLNDSGIASARGGEWSAGSVRQILLNPIYLGIAIRNRSPRGIYVQGGSPMGNRSHRR